MGTITRGYMSYNLNSLNEVICGMIQGSIIRLTEGDTRS